MTRTVRTRREAQQLADSHERTVQTLLEACREEQRLLREGMAVSVRTTRRGYRLRWMPIQRGPVKLRLGQQARAYSNGR